MGKRLVLHFLPAVETAAPSAIIIGWIFLVAMTAGLALSLWRRPVPPEAA